MDTDPIAATGAFDAAGVVWLQLHREADVSSVSDLLSYSLDELGAIAERKGGIRRLLDEKSAKVYRANAPLGWIGRADMSAAA